MSILSVWGPELPTRAPVGTSGDRTGIIGLEIIEIPKELVLWEAPVDTSDEITGIAGTGYWHFQ